MIAKLLIDTVQVQAVLEHGVEEYNKDFPRLKITLYEVQCFFPFLSIAGNALHSFIMDTFNQSYVAAFLLVSY